IYTSGTTGIPKGVMHRFSAIGYMANEAIQNLDLTAEDRILSYLPLAHIVERLGVEAVGLLRGGRVFFTEGLETFLVDLQRAQATLFLAVPRILFKFQQGVFGKIPREKLDRLLRIPLLRIYLKQRILHQLGLRYARYALCGAAPLPPEVLLWYRNLG